MEPAAAQRFSLPTDLSARLEDPSGPVPRITGLREAAVVALILPRADGDERHLDPELLLIERSSALRSHAGQLAFPGGKPEPEDADLLDTALREANEEVALPRDQVEVLGRLQPVPTPTGFLIVPFVAWAPRGWEPKRASPEVHRILRPSFAELTSPGVHRIAGQRTWNGILYDLHEYAIGTPPLWGATARMVWDLLQRL